MRKLFPVSWMAMNIVGFIASIIIYIAIGFIFFLLMNKTADWFVIKYFTKGLFYIIAVYSVAGIGISCFQFFVNKDKE